MKVAIIEVGGRGGITHYSYNLAQALSKTEGMEVVLITHEEYELEHLKRNFSVVKRAIRNQAYIKAILSIASVLKHIKPDIVHMQNLISARKDWLCIRLLGLLGAKIVFTAHNVFPHEKYEKNARGMHFAFSQIYKACAAVITHSEENKSELVKYFSLKAEKIAVIPHGNYLFQVHNGNAYTKEQAREKLGLLAHEKVALCFGAIREYKGIQHLIPAFSEVIKQVAHAKLLIVGPRKDREFFERIKHLINEYHLNEHIMMDDSYVPLEEFSLYFRAADIAVLPYLHTYGSGAAHSALAFGKPVIMNNFSLFEEMVENDKNGYLVRPYDVGALSRAIVACFNLESEQLHKMGERSLHIAKTKFSWSTIASATVELYKEIMQKRDV